MLRCAIHARRDAIFHSGLPLISGRLCSACTPATPSSGDADESGNPDNDGTTPAPRPRPRQRAATRASPRHPSVDPFPVPAPALHDTAAASDRVRVSVEQPGADAGVADLPAFGASLLLMPARGTTVVAPFVGVVAEQAHSSTPPRTLAGRGPLPMTYPPTSGASSTSPSASSSSRCHCSWSR